MTSAVIAADRAMWTPARALLLGGLTVGVLDGFDALVFFGLRGVSPARLFQGIASGLLGRSAFEGGMATALLGVLLHFFIAFAVVTTYHIGARCGFRDWPTGLGSMARSTDSWSTPS